MTVSERLHSTPEDVAAWEQALAQGARGFSTQRIQATLARLRPYDPSSTDPFSWNRAPAPVLGWLRHDDGRGPNNQSRQPALVPTLLRKLVPRLLSAPHSYFDRVGLGDDDHFLISKVGARWNRGRVHALVTRSASWQGPPEPLGGSARVRRTLEHTWAWGAGIDDCLQIVTLTFEQGDVEMHVGVALAASGSERFLERVQTAMTEATTFRWVAANQADLFPQGALIES